MELIELYRTCRMIAFKKSRNVIFSISLQVNMPLSFWRLRN